MAKPCFTQPPPGTWIVVGASSAGWLVQVIGPVVVPNRPPPMQVVSVIGSNPQDPDRLTLRVGATPEVPFRYDAWKVGC